MLAILQRGFQSQTGLHLEQVDKDFRIYDALKPLDVPNEEKFSTLRHTVRSDTSNMSTISSISQIPRK